MWVWALDAQQWTLLNLWLLYHEFTEGMHWRCWVHSQHILANPHYCNVLYKQAKQADQLCLFLLKLYITLHSLLYGNQKNPIKTSGVSHQVTSSTWASLKKPYVPYGRDFLWWSQELMYVGKNRVNEQWVSTEWEFHGHDVCVHTRNQAGYFRSSIFSSTTAFLQKTLQERQIEGGRREGEV